MSGEPGYELVVEGADRVFRRTRLLGYTKREARERFRDAVADAQQTGGRYASLTYHGRDWETVDRVWVADGEVG